MSASGFCMHKDTHICLDTHIHTCTHYMNTCLWHTHTNSSHTQLQNPVDSFTSISHMYRAQDGSRDWEIQRTWKFKYPGRFWNSPAPSHLKSTLDWSGSLKGNDWVRTSQVPYAHTTGRQSFHVESPGPDSDLSCRRLCGQQLRVRLSSCWDCMGSEKNHAVSMAPGNLESWYFRAQHPPGEGSDESCRTVWCLYCLCSVYMEKLTETVWLFTVLRHGASLGSEPAFINHGPQSFEMLFDQIWLCVPWELAQISQVLLGCPQTLTQLIIS